ncbi:hypothetical protein A2J04_23650 [Rhodococcus sp. EPR-279]|uniref:DUF6461 domain-containing protein n=2 Tax=unclassified Rhodococcus (in: high G+C Gram-positive bacteria) TaxID=192944 RepID=UPI0007BB692E|nr:DUF6461 domain-containing protein [Rhodococcus sp. EPR-279]KZF06453.1 hypothetical protein A2J04_23650 [Rhodococcus sp. EPR-279]
MRSYEDYMFIPAQYEGWIGNGYVSTIVCAASSSDVIQALQADDSERVTASGVKDLVLAEWDLDAAHKTDGLNTQLVGVIDLGDDKVLLVQQNSQYVAATETYLNPLFAGRDIVSHSSLGSGERFVWWSNGQVVADFDPYHYDPEEGVAPESVIDAARTIGGVGIDGPPPRNEGFPTVAGSFALADHLTQSRISPEILATGVFEVVVVRTGPALPPVQARTFESESSWGAVVDRYEKSYRLSRRGRAVETRADQVAEVRFWYRPLRSYRLEDEYGIRYVSDYRQNIWSRVDGVLVKDAPPIGLKVHPASLVEVHKNWDVELGTLLDDETEGTAVEIDGRPAWQFELPPGWQGFPGSVAFDSETGIALRWHTAFQTIEFTHLDVGTELADELFTGD